MSPAKQRFSRLARTFMTSMYHKKAAVWTVHDAACLITWIFKTFRPVSCRTGCKVYAQVYFCMQPQCLCTIWQNMEIISFCWMLYATLLTNKTHWNYHNLPIHHSKMTKTRQGTLSAHKTTQPAGHHCQITLQTTLTRGTSSSQKYQQQ